MTTSRKVLGIFAKQPIAGHVKTRLAAATSDGWAQRVAQAFLEDSLDRFSHVEASRVIAYAPRSGESFFAPLARGRYELAPQDDGDLGQRLRSFFDANCRHGNSRIVVLGADSPTLPVEYVEQAFAALETSDVVIGPAFDGGYYLVGSSKEVPLFDDIPWSSPHVLVKTIERLQGASARLALLPPWYDVDTADDWAMLCGHVRALRLAGVDPGVPRVEMLMQTGQAPP